MIGRISIFLFLSFTSNLLFSQVTSGKIVFERKTNLYKKYKSDDMKEWLGTDNKNKVDVFELYFNDSLSVFKPQESELKENFSWATNKNTTYQNFKTNQKYTIKDVWGEQVNLQDSLTIRKWKITDSKRKICGYDCRKAIWQANDSTRIYAWYADDLIVSTGPESFNGLPGTILGLATEDGGVIYFAKSVTPQKTDITILNIPKTKGRIYTSPELRKKLEKQYGKESWGKEMLQTLFDIW